MEMHQVKGDYMEKKRLTKEQRINRLRWQRRGIVAAFLLVIVFIIWIMIQVNHYRYVNQKEFRTNQALENVYIDELDVSGMTASEIEESLGIIYSSAGASLLTLKAEGNSSDVYMQELGLTCEDLGALAEEAVNYGKKGSVSTRYRQLQNLKEKKHVLPMKYMIDEAQAAALIEERGVPLCAGAVNASIENENGNIQVVEGQDGTTIDVDASVKKLADFLNDKWSGEAATFQLETKAEQPEVTAKDLEEVKDVLGTYTTYYGADGTGRAQNVESGANNINGSVIKPGEEFSANAAMEPYTEAHGYAPAASYAGNEVTETMGGGICQVSSTLYNAVLLAELEVTQRNAHSMLVTYVEPSMDAAIADDVMDLKFKNNYDTPVYIEGTLTDGGITFTIYGKETRDASRRVEYVSETLSTEAAEAGTRFIATDDPIGTYTVESEAHQGLSAQLWKVVYENWVEESREVVNTSEYVSSPRTIAVGTASEDAEAVARITSAIQTQDETTILSAIYGGY